MYLYSAKKHSSSANRNILSLPSHAEFLVLHKKKKPLQFTGLKKVLLWTCIENNGK